MIQRIQSVFLALVAICLFSSMLLDFWGKVGTEGQLVELNAMQLILTENGEVTKTVNTFYLIILAFIGSSLAVGSLFSYKNRLRQMQLNFFNTLVIAGMMLTSVYFIFEGAKMFEVEQQGLFGYGFYMAPAALIFNMLANRFIRKDEKLVRSVDRLR